ncbi:MAG: SPASM domain-containing protein, partial [Deltaproteobacteria bacterium]|nr:SPASM domain-containing protein [Deltaproteobacteria bacterium]
MKLFDLWIKDGFPHVSIRLFEDMLIYLIDGVHVSCCWMDQCGAYTVVEYNGDCYPCDFFVYPQWKLGNILENKLETIL